MCMLLRPLLICDILIFSKRLKVINKLSNLEELNRLSKTKFHSFQEAMREILGSDADVISVIPEVITKIKKFNDLKKIKLLKH